MKKLVALCFVAAIAVGIGSCKKDNQNPTGQPDNVVKAAPDGFNFSSSKNVTVNVTLRDNNDGPLKGVVLSVYAADNTNEDASLIKGVTDNTGKFTATLSVPSYYTKLIIDPAYVGLMRNATANINGSAVNVVIGGKAGYGGDIVPDAINNVPQETTSVKNGRQVSGLLGTEYGYPFGFNLSNAFTGAINLGRPAYLETTSDVIDASLLSYVNSSLPESKTVPNLHPEYLTSSATRVINVTAKSDVWITFVSEGAGFQNALGFYTYKTGSPPNSPSGGTLFGGIDKITYVFPNASTSGSGGGLKSGDKVKLGTFEAGTTIGFVLLQNAWSGSGVNTSGTKFYTQDEFNPESTSALRKHTVMLYDAVHKLYLLGFEDQNRGGSSDNDFNDLVVYASANPITAISNNGVAVIDDGGDRDGDGVLDELDSFPDDGTRAYISYYPSASKMATLAFEDNWPKKGDYDLNDLVVNYRYSFTSNAANQVVELKGEFKVAASGASFHNGFGVQLPVAASAVTSVTGQQLMSNYITLAANGVEAGQSKAVIIPFDNHEILLKNPDLSYFVNTRNDKDKVTNGGTATVVVKFGTPVASSVLTASAINPFIIGDLRRGYEGHLPGYAPTDKATVALFGKDDDNSVALQNRYYQTKENLPWGISFSEGFSYPVEGANISTTYLHFNDWASSGGISFVDWYTSTAAGYRSAANVYSK
jgi:LruC domain-containing protein